MPNAAELNRFDRLGSARRSRREPSIIDLRLILIGPLATRFHGLPQPSSECGESVVDGWSQTKHVFLPTVSRLDRCGATKR